MSHADFIKETIVYQEPFLIMPCKVSLVERSGEQKKTLLFLIFQYFQFNFSPKASLTILTHLDVPVGRPSSRKPSLYIHVKLFGCTAMQYLLQQKKKKKKQCVTADWF